MKLFDESNTGVTIQDTTKKVLELLPQYRSLWMRNTTVHLEEGTLLCSLDRLLRQPKFEKGEAVGLVRKVWSISDDMAQVYLHLGLKMGDVSEFKEKILIPISMTGLDRLDKNTPGLLIVSSLFSNEAHTSVDAAKGWIMKHLSRSHAAEYVVKTLMGSYK